MFKTVSSVVAALACVALASPSHAQSFSPSWGALNGSGEVKLVQTATVNCKISTPYFNVMTPSYISIPGHSLIPSHLLCGVWATTYGAWSAYVVPGSTTEIDITLGFSQIAPCYGTIRAQWDNATHRATFTNTLLPAVNPSQPNCVITGWISVPALSII